MKPQRDPLEALLDAYFDGGLDEESQRALDGLLNGSAGARQAFWKRAAMEAALENWADESRGGVLAALPEVVPARRPTRRPFVAWTGWAVAAAVALAWLLQDRKNGGPSTPTDGAVAGTGHGIGAGGIPVAYLSRASGVVPGSAWQPGRLLEAGREYEIGAGLVELDFYSGARVAIEGPARFTSGSDMRLGLGLGKVQVDVPESARGFVVMLPEGTVTDPGSGFAAEVGAGGRTLLQAGRGGMEFEARDGGGLRRLAEGEALSFGGGDDPRPADSRPFALASAIESRSVEEQARRADAWQKACEEMAADPALTVHFRFLPDEDGQRVILNRAHRPRAPKTGTVIAAEWSRGRWQDKPALVFRGKADRVRLDIEGEYPRATWFAWVKVDGLPRRYNGLFFSEFGTPGEVHWQLSPEGRFLFGVRPSEERREGAAFHRAFSEPVLGGADFGIWRMLATTYDAGSREVAHFVDGVEIHRSQVAESVPLRFGKATMGNFFDPAPDLRAAEPGLGDDWSFRNWTGSFDEFALFSRVLGKDEIDRIYQAGRPY